MLIGCMFQMHVVLWSNEAFVEKVALLNKTKNGHTTLMLPTRSAILEAFFTFKK